MGDTAEEPKDELDEIEESMHVSRGNRNNDTLDPVPKTKAGENRFLYYEAEEIQADLESADFDDQYEHHRSRDFRDILDKKDEDEKDNMTFGSRPPTAPA